MTTNATDRVFRLPPVPPHRHLPRPGGSWAEGKTRCPRSFDELRGVYRSFAHDPATFCQIIEANLEIAPARPKSCYRRTASSFEYGRPSRTFHSCSTFTAVRYTVERGYAKKRAVLFGFKLATLDTGPHEPGRMASPTSATPGNGLAKLVTQVPVLNASQIGEAFLLCGLVIDGATYS